MSYPHLSPAEGQAALKADPELIVLDVRTPMEFAMHRIEGAVLLPIQELQMRLLELDRGARYLVTCEHGVRSRMACDYLHGLGFASLRNLTGGMANWIAAGLPIVRG
ncbi:MAG: rhodanese-like domain-containing protein [Planctomycetota bacterium]